MPHEYIATDAPLSAVGSAAQRTVKNEDYSEAFIQPGEADYGRHKFRVVAGGPPIIENDDYPFIRAVDEAAGRSKAKEKKSKTYQGPRHTEKNEFRNPGLKKLNKKQIALDLPATPRGCEWRRSDDGMNLWRCWTEWANDKASRIKKSRYAGHLSEDAWRIMKEYDHEAFISTVGERLRRHSGR
ncbi:MAG: hypothetical protein MOB07_17670 [Acidobacteria bacterium]|nr:hypothetical protein [Acidobacteriota bacterium]